MRDSRFGGTWLLSSFNKLICDGHESFVKQNWLKCSWTIYSGHVEYMFQRIENNIFTLYLSIFGSSHTLPFGYQEPRVILSRECIIQCITIIERFLPLTRSIIPFQRYAGRQACARPTARGYGSLLNPITLYLCSMTKDMLFALPVHRSLAKNWCRTRILMSSNPSRLDSPFCTAWDAPKRSIFRWNVSTFFYTGQKELSTKIMI